MRCLFLIRLSLLPLQYALNYHNYRIIRFAIISYRNLHWLNFYQTTLQPFTLSIIFVCSAFVSLLHFAPASAKSHVRTTFIDHFHAPNILILELVFSILIAFSVRRRILMAPTTNAWHSANV